MKALDRSLVFSQAEDPDAAEIAALRAAAAVELTRQYGHGHWSSQPTERGVMTSLKTARVLVARLENRIVGTLRLATKKPWAIDPSYFTKVARPLYLTDMAVAPAEQRKGVGRLCLEEAVRIARSWPADAIRLDAYAAAAGAGAFYAKCGFSETGRVVYRNNPLIYFEKVL